VTESNILPFKIKDIVAENSIFHDFSSIVFLQDEPGCKKKPRQGRASQFLKYIY